MPFPTYLVNMLVAAALGAGTNELAIVAILRYILPRKKGEIARRIRDIVATDLISPDKMRDKLDEPKVGELLHRHIDRALAELLARDLPDPETLLEGHRAEVDALRDRLRETLLDEFARAVSDPGFSDAMLRPFLEERWRVLRRRAPRSFIPDSADSLPSRVAGWLSALERSEPLRAAARSVLDGWLAGKLERSASAADFLSPALLEAVEELAVAQAPALVGQLTDALRDDALQDTVSDAMMAAIGQQLQGQGILGEIKGALVGAMRIREDVRGICRRLPDILYRNFHRPENRAAFESVLRDAVRRVLRHRLDEDAKSPAARERLVDMLLERAWREKYFRRLGDGAAAVAAAALDRSIEETLERAGADVSSEAALDALAARCRHMLLSDSTRRLLAAQFDELAAAWMSRPLGRLGRFVSEAGRERAAAVAAEEVRLMLRARLAEFAEESGVWDIVVSSIEAYDDRQLSDLVQHLARSELRWVTVLGGVIGAVVGLAQTFMQTRGWF